MYEDGIGDWIAWEFRGVDDAALTKREYPNGGGFKSPLGRVGDSVWIRETWSYDHSQFYPCFPIVYRADDCIVDSDRKDGMVESNGRLYPFKWQPSIHMKRKDARIFWRNIGAGAQRLQSISRDDAQAEGIPQLWGEACNLGLCSRNVEDMDRWDNSTTIENFARLWDSIYGQPQRIHLKQRDKSVYVSYPWEDIREVREHNGLPHFVIGNPWVFWGKFERIINSE